MAEGAPVTFWPQAAEPQLATQRRPVPHRELLDWKILPTKDEEGSTLYTVAWTIEWFQPKCSSDEDILCSAN